MRERWSCRYVPVIMGWGGGQSDAIWVFEASMGRVVSQGPKVRSGHRSKVMTVRVR